MPSNFSFADTLKAAIMEERNEEPPIGAASPESSPLSSPLSLPSPSPVLLPVLPLLIATEPSLASPPVDATFFLEKPPPSRSKRHSKAKKKQDREKRKAVTDLDHSPPRDTKRRHIDPSEPMQTSFDLADQQVSHGAYVGWRDEPLKTKTPSLSEMVGEASKYSFNLVKWDASTSVPIVDEGERVAAVMLSNPRESNWEAVAEGAALAIKEESRNCSFSKKQKKHRRGRFPALATGVSHGGGQRHPGNLCNNKDNTPALERLRTNVNIRRLAGHASSGFKTWAPNLFAHYLLYRNALLLNMSFLIFAIVGSIWATATFNFGPRTVSTEHTDHGNIPYGWCAVTALGWYDYTKGGHLILWDLKLVIEFPPGSTILIPSGVLRHSNVSIGKNEERYSIAQYTSGGLFRWVDNDFQTDEDWRAQRSEDEVRMAREGRWEKGLELFSTLDELRRVPESES